MHWTVSPEDSGLSLQAYITKKIPEYSAKKVKKLVDAGKCTLNGRVERFSTKPVGRGDRIDFSPEAVAPALPQLSLDHILYADTAVVAYDKPAGVVSEDPRFIALLHGKLYLPTLIHRLDKNTSGVLLFATKGAASDHMEKQFRQREIQKRYLAIIDGIPKATSGIIEMSMGKLTEYQGQAVWGEVKSGLRSLTEWRVVKKGHDASVVWCEPQTGRTHQLRVHLASIGHPILGDHHYGRHFVCAYRPERMMLHAAEVTFVHPLTGKEIKVQAPLPADFKETMQQVIGSDEVSDH